MAKNFFKNFKVLHWNNEADRVFDESVKVEYAESAELLNTEGSDMSFNVDLAESDFDDVGSSYYVEGLIEDKDPDIVLISGRPIEMSKPSMVLEEDFRKGMKDFYRVSPDTGSKVVEALARNSLNSSGVSIWSTILGTTLNNLLGKDKNSAYMANDILMYNEYKGYKRAKKELPRIINAYRVKAKIRAGARKNLKLPTLDDSFNLKQV